MLLEFACQNCGALFRAGRHAAESVRCPRCRAPQLTQRGTTAEELPAAVRQVDVRHGDERVAAEPSFNPYQSPTSFLNVSAATAVRSVAMSDGAASRWSRLWAAMTDGLILTAAVVLFHIAHLALLKTTLPETGLRGDVADDSWFSPSQAELAAYFAVSLLQGALIAIRGQSVGKMLFGIRIVRCGDDGKAGFFCAVLLRHWLPLAIRLLSPPPVAAAFYLIDVCWIFFPQARCLHDLFSGARVITVRRA